MSMNQPLARPGSGGPHPDQATRPGNHLLFVEDAPALRGPLTALLELEGYRVGWAANGREALEYVRRGDRPDLILLDLMLPGMDGRQFRREAQRDPALASIPVVVVSGAGDLAQTAAALGAAAYLEKPVVLAELVE